MAHLKLDMPPEAWRALLPFLNHHGTHAEASPLAHDPERVFKHLEEAIREQFPEKAVRCFIDSHEVDCETFRQEATK